MNKRLTEKVRKPPLDQVLYSFCVSVPRGGLGVSDCKGQSTVAPSEPPLSSCTSSSSLTTPCFADASARRGI
eukprot:2812923-Amphidinium_carterae.1